MHSELKNSINQILNERITSPFFGTLIVSWLIINWKIVYLTLFVSESELSDNKINYIIDNFSKIETLVYYPILSTIILITVIPLISNGSYWINLTYKQWRIDKKHKIEKKQLLTIEQSLFIRQELKDKELNFEKLITDKEQEIELLKIQIKDLQNKTRAKDNQLKSLDFDSSKDKEYVLFKKTNQPFSHFENIAKEIKKSEQFPKGTPENIKEYYLINHIVEKEIDEFENNKPYYLLTTRGENYYREYFNERFENQTNSEK